ncbi:hypothetical protein ACMFMG_000552 [Clarireedia jacksonii]
MCRFSSERNCAMYLISSTMRRLLLCLIVFAFPAYSALATNESFIYPGASKNATANVSDIAVYRNDSMIVEYSQFANTTTLTMWMNCFDSQETALEADSWGPSDSTQMYASQVSGFGPCEFNCSFCVQQTRTYSHVQHILTARNLDENTGLLKWSFANGYLSTSNQTYCRFLLYNESIVSCAWGPWDKNVSSPVQTGYFDAQTLFAYSPVFRLFTNATSSRQPTLWTKKATATEETVDASKTISTTQAATCPPSGIPPSPIPTEWAVDRWPPLMDGLEFPFDPKAIGQNA